ncbi:MAG: formate C-acetyltransferase/glycerol dehydratase family glycyl radical enzyme, partial [Thermoleophilia bacterium]|nr:formate C-acetyltransferase/glycerol dehydratase family glycyl radical enzyme [Thermoleophilia bacterium]
MATREQDVHAPDVVDIAGTCASQPAASSRIARLRKQYFMHKPSVCVERALAYTEVFKETEGEPVVIRRAKGLKRACATKSILIQADELIVGNAGRRPRTGVLGPEMSAYWFGKELDTLSTRAQDPYVVDDEQKVLFREQIEPYWRGKTVIEHWLTR